MNLVWVTLAFLLVLVGCVSRTHQTPANSADLRAFEYCDGELWGYMLRSGANAADDVPLAVYLHMHSDLTPDPAHALMLFVELRAQTAVTFEIPRPILTVQIDSEPPRQMPLRVYVLEQMKSAEDRFPYPAYETKLVNAETNTWSVAKLNSFFYLIKSEAKLHQLPLDRRYELTRAIARVPFDTTSTKHIWLRGAVNLWPENQPLRNASLSVELPDIMVNGRSLQRRRFSYQMNYGATATQRRRSRARVCPSSELIFSHNSF